MAMFCQIVFVIWLFIVIFGSNRTSAKITQVKASISKKGIVTRAHTRIDPDVIPRWPKKRSRKLRNSLAKTN